MLVYEFKCSVCSAIIEADKPDAKLRHCNRIATRIFGVVGIHLKGSGFYTNDKKGPDNGSI